MMLQNDTDNVLFTVNCLAWLTADQRDQVLLIDEEGIKANFDVPTMELPGAMIPPDLMVPIFNDVVAELEARDAFNDLLLQLVPLRTILEVLAVLLTVGLLLYGLQFLVRTRHRFDLWIPLLGSTLARRGPAGPMLQQRHWALLEAGNLWE